METAVCWYVRSCRREGKVDSEDGDSRFLGTLVAVHKTTECYSSKESNPHGHQQDNTKRQT
jgi:hypothetical protein